MPQREDPGAHQTDLAEGELETVEESIRIHEKQQDGQAPPPNEQQEKQDAP